MPLFWRVALASMLALGASSCIETKRSFDEFGDRLDAKLERDRLRALDAEVAFGDAATCEPVTAKALSGEYYFALLAPIAPNQPILAILTIDAKQEGADIVANLVLDPVAVSDQRTPVGQKNEAEMTVKDGDAFSTPNFAVVLPGNSNPVLKNTEARAKMKLSGKTCWSGRGALDFLCGQVSGDITEPLPVTLKDATFGATRIVQGDEFPPIVRSCADRVQMP